MEMECHPEVFDDFYWSYYEWLLDIVDVDSDGELGRICEALFWTEFEWDIPRDENRAMDGLELRRQFDPYYELENVIPEECTALEMMVALASRIETEIMWDDKKGDRTGLWFRIMLHFLYLQSGFCDTFLSFCDTFEMKSVTNFFKKGSDFRLFLSKKHPKSAEKVEIWYQMHAFLLENYDF